MFDLSGKAPRLIAVTLPDVAAWAKHMAHATRVRMLALEPGIIAAVSEGRLTPSMVLLRSHAETAGLACLSLMTLRSGDGAAIATLIQSALFGSAMTRDWKASPDLAGLLQLTESEPPKARALMDALDAFAAAGDKGNGRYRAFYGLLCEYAHPNSRGTLGFMRSTELGLGWTIRYTPTEEAGGDDIAMALSLMLEFMRLGYSSSELLRQGTVVETERGFTIAPPSERAFKRILTKLMLLKESAQ